jgi:hypothetical protein
MVIYRVFYNTTNTFKFFTTLAATLHAIVDGHYEEVATLETESLSTLFREMNVVDGTELPVKLKVRSLSVGDIVMDVMARKCWYCSPVGWTELDQKCHDILELSPGRKPKGS